MRDLFTCDTCLEKFPNNTALHDHQIETEKCSDGEIKSPDQIRSAMRTLDHYIEYYDLLTKQYPEDRDMHNYEKMKLIWQKRALEFVFKSGRDTIM